MLRSASVLEIPPVASRAVAVAIAPRPENSLCTDGLTCHVLSMGSFHTDFLTATSTPLTGAGTIWNILGNYYEYNQSNTPQQADALAIMQDWGMVSQDFRGALSLGLKELSKDLENVRR